MRHGDIDANQSIPADPVGKLAKFAGPDLKPFIRAGNAERFQPMTMDYRRTRMRDRPYPRRRLAELSAYRDQALTAQPG